MADPIKKEPSPAGRLITHPHFHYQVYGKRLCSTIPLPELPHNPFQHKDIAFRYGPPLGKAASLPLEQAQRMLRRETTQGDMLSVYALGQRYLLRWEDLCDFVVSQEGREITCHASSAVDHGWVTATLYGFILSFALHLMGDSNLHASAVVLPSGAVGFLATPGTGKSSLATAFATHGHPFLTDDVLALQENTSRVLAFPGFPFTSLSAYTVDGLGLLLPQSTPLSDEKTRVAIDGTWASFCDKPVPLRALFILHREAKNRTIDLDCLPKAEALRELLENTTSLALLPAKHLEQHMAFLARLLTSIPVWRLSYPEGFEHASEIKDKVLKQIADTT